MYIHINLFLLYILVLWSSPHCNNIILTIPKYLKHFTSNHAFRTLCANNQTHISRAV